MNHQHKEVTSTQPYEFKTRSRMIAGIMIIIGLVSVIAQFVTHHDQTWPNLLMNNYYFMLIALGATFFLAVQYVADVGWSVVIKRVLEAISQYLWIAGVLMVVIILFGGHHLYHWMHSEILVEKLPNGQLNPEYDKIIAGKSAFLNVPFFWIRVVAYFCIWSGFAFLFRKNSLKMDAELGRAVDYYNLNKKYATAFLVLFAITSSTMAWDFVMSIETHWFSTLFGWYTFAGLFVTSLCILAFTVGFLKSKGYLPEVTDNHIQDIGKFMFAFSVFWTYLWFAQFMLIWYANIPEEITYFMLRQDHYRELWIGSFLINFICPFIILMTRDAKRKIKLLMAMAVLLFIGHWMDTYIMVIPGSMALHSHDGMPLIGTIGWMEIGTTIGFLGLFMYWVQHNLAKAPLVIKNHPMMEESLHHVI